MDKYACVIVTYFPNSSSLEHIEKISDLCGVVIVVDNTPLGKKPLFPSKPNLIIHNFKENAGLAKGMNKGIEIAGKKGFENIFLLDQDSYVPNHFFGDMLRFKSEVDKRANNFAIYVPDFWDRYSKSSAKFPVLSRFTVRHAACGSLIPSLEDRAIIAITSGSLITYSMFNKLGSFKDGYFIDFLDNEYCLRANKIGYTVAVNCSLILNHSIGKRSRHRFFSLTIKPNHHSAVRRYYIFRNGIRTAIDYFRYYPSYTLLLAARFSHEILSILLYEDNRPRKIRAIGYGIYHGLIGKMGKCPLFENHDICDS